MNTGRRIKVLTITTSGLVRKEGISTIILDYFSRLDKSKFNLQLIASGEDFYELVQAFQDIGVTIHYLPSRKKSMKAYLKAFINLCKKESYDVIYIHGSSTIMAIEFYIARHYGCKSRISHCHNTKCNHPIIDKILRPIFSKIVTKRLACGQDAGKYLYRSQSFIVINNARDPDLYKFNYKIRIQTRVKLGLSDDYIAIGHVGNFNPQKNQAYLIKIFAKIKSKMPKSKLFLIGDGQTRSNIANIVKKLGLSTEVVFTGNISFVSDMLQAMDVMLLPSLHEGLPLSVIEWQMAGLPCLISDKVTDDCIFTELVSYKSLQDSDDDWADEAIRIMKVNRALESVKAIAAAKKKGFDINSNVKVLDKVLSCGVQ